MLFDWFTFSAQLVNFLLLVWLLKRFLFKPILKAVDEREKHIATQIHEAEAIKRKAANELELFKNKNDEFERNRQQLINTAITEIESERRKQVEQIRSEIEKLRRQLLETLRNEQQTLNSTVIDLAHSGVFSIARKALSDLASKNLEEQITEVFISRIKNLGIEEKNLMKAEITKVQGKFIIRSAFEIPQDYKMAIKQFFEQEINQISNPVFDLTPRLITGIELVAGGYKLVWNIDNYLAELESGIEKLLEEKL